MRVITALAGLALVAASGHAQATAEQLSRCAAMRTTTARLQCYDALAKPKPATTRAATGGLGKWVVSRETDPISDQKGVTFMLEADGGGILDTRSLIIRCRRGELDVLVAPHEYLGSENANITIRLGTDAPLEEEWTPSTDHTGLFHPGDQADIEAFVRTLVRYDRVAFQVQPYEKAPLAMVFRLAGIAAVTRELWETCPPGTDKVERKDYTVVADTIFLPVEPSSGQVFMESVVEERPEVVSGPHLQYPDLLREAAIQGRVLVQAIIDPTGRAEPNSVKVIQSPNPGFDQPAMDYVRGALFRPARVHGRAVRVLINLPIDFKIKR